MYSTGARSVCWRVRSCGSTIVQAMNVSLPQNNHLVPDHPPQHVAQGIQTDNFDTSVYFFPSSIDSIHLPHATLRGKRN